MDIESIVRKIGERQKEEVEERIRTLSKRGNITNDDLPEILDEEGFFKRTYIERLATKLKINRTEYRPAIDEVQQGMFREHLIYLKGERKKKYYVHPGIRTYLPKTVKDEVSIGGPLSRQENVDQAIIKYIGLAFDAALHGKTDIVMGAAQFVANQLHEGVIWLPLSLHPFVSLPALKEDRFLNDDDVERMLRDWDNPPPLVTDEWYSWLMEVRTRIVKQRGLYPPELRGVSEDVMKVINEFTLLIGYSTIAGRKYPTLADGMEIPDVFEISKELVEKANIDLQGLAPPVIKWTKERYFEDEGKAQRWLRLLFEFLNDDRKLWIELAKKRIELQKEVRRGTASEHLTVSYWHKPIPPRHEPELKEGFLSRKRRAKKRD